MSKLQIKVELMAAVENVRKQLTGIGAASKTTSKEVRDLQDKLKALGKSQGNIDAFRNVSRSLAITGNRLQEAQAKVADLQKRMDSAAGPTKAMTRELEQAKLAASQLKSEQTQLIQRQQQLRTTLAASGISTKSLATHQRELKANTAQASSALAQQEARLKEVNAQMQKMHAVRARADKLAAVGGKMKGAGTRMAATGAAVTAAAHTPVMAYATAEDASTQLKVAMMQKGGKVAAEFSAVNELAEKLGNKLPGTTADFQNMMTMLIRQGMPANAILGGLGEATAYLGVQLKMAPEAAAEFASKLQDATRTTDKDMMGLMDTIQKTFYLGVDQNNMLQGFSKLSPALSIIKKEGLGAAQALAPLLVMTDQAGMAGEAAGNAFRKIFQLSMDKKKTAKGNAELAGTGIKLDFTDGKGEFGGLDKMYAQLEQLKGVNTQQRLGALKKIFGDDAETLQALTVMIEKGAAGYKEVQDKMAKQAAIQERVNAQLGTLKNLWDAASGTFTNALVAFGESIAPELHATAQWLGSVAEKTQKWAKENPTLAHGIMTCAKWLGLLLIAGGGLVVVLGAVLGPLAMLKVAAASLGLGLGTLGTVFNVLLRGFGLIGSTIMWLGRMLLMNPIGLAITAIAAAAYLIYTYWEPIKGFFVGLWGGIKSVFESAGSFIFDFLMNWTPIGFIVSRWEDLSAITAAIWGLIKSAVVSVAMSIMDFFMNWTIIGVIVRHWDDIVAATSAAWEFAKGIAISAGRAISDFFMNWTIFGFVIKHWDDISGYFSALPARFAEFGGMIMDGLANGITNRLSAVKDALTGAGDSVISWFKEKLGIHSPSRVFAEFGGFTMEGLNQGILQNQQGPLAAVMDTAKKMTTIGAGLTLSTGMALAGNLDTRPALPSQASSAASASAPSQIVIHVHAAPGMDEKALAKLVQQEIARAQQGQSARQRAALSDRD